MSFFTYLRNVVSSSGSSSSISLMTVAIMSVGMIGFGIVNSSHSKNSSSISNKPFVAGQIDVTKNIISHPSGIVSIGDTLTFQIIYSNTGADDIVSLNLIDSFPSTKLQYIGSTEIMRRTFVNPSQDTWLNQFRNTNNYGGNNVIEVIVDGGTDDKRGLMQFDLSSFAGIPVQSPEIFVNINNGDGNGNDIEFYSVTTPWLEGDATWDDAIALTSWTTSGGDYSSTLLGSIPTINTGYLSTVLPMTIIQDWIDNPASNFGVALLSSGNTSDRLRISSREAAANRVPYLSLKVDGLPDLSTTGEILWENVEGLAAGTSDTVEVSFLAIDSCGTCRNFAMSRQALDVLGDNTSARNGTNFSIISCIGINSSSTNVSCFGENDGEAIVTPIGNVPFSYLWSDGQTDSTASNLIAGTYTVTVTDATPCTATAEITITEPIEVGATVAYMTDFGGGAEVSCPDATDGQIYVAGYGGDDSVHTYDWSNGATDTSGITNLSIGTYTVTISDAIGCTGVETYELTAPTAMVIDTAYTTDNIALNPGFNGYGVNCYGDNNGQVWFSISGGTGAHSYAWSIGETTNPGIVDLRVGTYTITVTDDLGCTASASYEITSPDSIIITESIKNVSCNGESTGEVSVTVTGGVSPYDYLWNDLASQDSSVAIGLRAGDYIVTVTDSNGCVATKGVSITEPTTALSASITDQTNVDCFGNSTGEAIVTPSGGTSGYTYLWSDISGQIDSTATGLPEGTYTVTVTDLFNCTTTSTVTITEPTTLTSSITDQTNVDCNGNSTGEAIVTPSGGTSGYTYLWSDISGQTDSTASGLPEGTYMVTVTDAQSCTTTSTVTITEPAAALISSITGQTNVDCFGNSTGEAIVTPSGGTSGYTYLWSDISGQTDSTATGLSEGTYTVTVTDAQSCTTTSTVTITEPTTALSASITDQTNVDCFGNSTGEAIVTPSGGTSGYTYLWSDISGQTDSTATGLPEGTYTVTVTDAQSCTATSTVSITEPAAALTSSITGQTNVDCFGNSTGEAIVTPSGGTSGYTYLWNDVSNQTDSTASGLREGTYTVTVTDAQSCTTTSTVTITEPAAALTSSITGQTNVDCFGNSTGEVIVTPAGGTSGYTYLWSDVSGQTDSTATGLPAGNYTVTVTDAQNCTSTSVTTITQPTALSSSITDQTNVDCFGNSTGVAIVTPGGGTSGYTYLWSDVSGQTDSTATGLSVGTYTVTVTDAQNCTTTSTVSITQPSAALSSSITSQTNVDCNGNSTGAATVGATGGTSSYTYLWNDAVNQTTAIASGLIAGNYTVTVTDARNCTSTSTVEITELSALNVSISSQTNVDCNGNSTGVATASGSGGAGSYTYSWSEGQTGDVANGFAAGTHTVTVTDANLCNATTTVTILQPTVLSVTIPTKVNPDCNGNSTGSATALGAGGTPGYTYLWSDILGQTDSIATGLPAGTYTVTITDLNLCTATRSVSLVNPPVLSASITGQTNVDCNGNSTGEAIVTPGGGTPGYTYLWSDVGGQTDSTATGLPDGTYTVTVTDAQNCTSTVSVSITEPTTLGINLIDQKNVSCKGGGDGEIIVEGTDGTPGYTYVWSLGGSTSDTLSNLSIGTYTVTVTDNNTCSTSISYTILEPSDSLNITGSTTDVECNGGTDGNINTVNVTGGTSGTNGYTFDWSDFNTEAIYPFEQNMNDESGNGHNAISINSAGIEQYSTDAKERNYSFHFNGTTRIRYDDGAGFFEAPFSQRTVTMWIKPDEFNDIETLYEEGDEFDGMALRLDGNELLGAVNRFGFSNVQAGPIILPNPAIWYHVALVFDNGDLTLYVDAASPSTITAGFTSIQSHGASGGIGGRHGTDVFGDGLGTRYEGLMDDFRYFNSALTNDQITDVMTNDGNRNGLAADTYSVTVTDANGCTVVRDFTINEPSVLEIVTTVTNPLCFDDDNGKISVSMSGGTAPYSYSWTTGSAIDSIINLAPGTYTVTVTDFQGCTITASGNINEPNNLVANITNARNVTCNSGSDGSISMNVNGGTGSYTYAWNNGAGTIEDPTNLSAGTYTVTVTDENGCTTTESAIISEPTAMVINSTITDLRCFGDTDGEIEINVQNGTGPYNYSWAPGGQTSDNISGLSAGAYTVTVTDAALCTAVQVISVNSPDEIEATAVIDNVDCFGEADGAVLDLTVTGGVPNYTFLWNDMGIEAYYPWEYDSTAASPAMEFVNDKSGNGNNLTGITGSVYYDDVDKTERYSSMYFDGNTKLQYSVYSGGFMTAPVDYRSITMWIKPDDLIGRQVLYEEGNLEGGLGLRLNGNTLQGVVLVRTSPTAISTFQVTAPYPNDGAWHHVALIYDLGELKLFIDGIEVDSGASGLGNFPLDPNSEGGFGGNHAWSVFVVYDYSVAAIVGLAISGSDPAVDYYQGHLDFTTYHNIALTDDQLNDLMNNTGDRNGLIAGNYTVTIYDENGCTKDIPINVTEPDELTVSNTFSNVKCKDGTDGSIDLTPTGGTTPYVYTWSNSDTTQDVSNLAANDYTVTVTDFNGCTVTMTQTITEPLLLEVTTSPALTYGGYHISCYGASDGSLSATVTGGTTNYSYQWSLGPTYTSNVISGLSSGTYTVTVTDANDCIATSSFLVQDPPQISLTLNNSIEVSCNGEEDATITTTVSGGIGSYTYKWNTGPTTADLSGIGVGTYSVIVTDSFNCSREASISIVEPNTLTVDISVNTSYNGFPVSCAGASDGQIISSVSGGTGTINYLWNSTIPDSTTLSNIGAGTYILEVSDANGCTAADTVLLQAPTAIDFDVTSSDLTDCGLNNGTVSILATGGVGVYEYRVNTGSWQSANTFYSLTPGTYDVFVRNAFGTCEVGPTTVVVDLPEVPIINNIIIINPTTTSSTDGSIIVNASGNSGNTTKIQYRIPGFADWQDSNVFNNMLEGVYTVEIKYFNQTCISSKIIELIAGAGVVGSDQGTSYCSDEVNGAQLVETYFIPIPEDQMLQSLRSVYDNGCPTPLASIPSDPIQSYVSIGIVENGVKIYYDHWEDDPVPYEPNLAFPNPFGTTEIWGDGDINNGIAPGYVIDEFKAGDRIILDNTVQSTTRKAIFDYDGGDKIASQGNIAITRLGWATGSGTLLAGAVEVYPTTLWGTQYEIPVGQLPNDPETFDMFSYTGATIMAEEDGTTVNLPGGGTVTLAQGASYLIDGGLDAGDQISANKNIQVHLLTGDRCATYEGRWLTLKPTNQWSNTYYAPVSTPDAAATYIHLYNPDPSNNIQVRWETSTGIVPAPITIISGGINQVKIPNGTGAKFYTEGGEIFYAIATIDSENDGDGNSAHDWGFALIPEEQLTSQITLVSFAPGFDPSLGCSTNEVISKSSWTLQSVDSENNTTTHAGTNAIDGNDNTFWLTEFIPGDIGCTSGNATEFTTATTGVINPNNAIGSPNSTYAEIYDEDDRLVLNLGKEIPAGETYNIIWRRKSTYTNTQPADIIVEESNDGITWTENPSRPSTTEKVSFITTPVIASSNTQYLRIREETNSNDDFDFDAVSFTCGLPVYELNATNDGQTITTCGGIFCDSGGAGNDYSNNEDYTITFCSDDGGTIQIDFTDWLLESHSSCDYDELSIYDGNSVAAPLIGDFCGTSSPGSITSTGTCLTVNFTSDGSATFSGWKANVLCENSAATGAAMPHEIEINLGASETMTGFRYTPRQDGNSTGHIAEYEFYVSNDGVSWGTPVVTGTWSVFSTAAKEVSFSEETAQYVKLIINSEINGNPWASMAELDLLECTVSVSENAAPVWITTDHLDGSPDDGKDVTICIDHDGDGGAFTDSNGVTYDEQIVLAPLERDTIYDNNDTDQSGTRIWVCDNSGAILAGAWGQDPSRASPGSPAIDLGVGLPNGIPFSTSKCVDLSNDFNNNGLFDECDEIFYTIIIENTGALPLSTGSIIVKDTLPSELTYIDNTTFSRQNGVDNVITDGGVTNFPLDETGHIYNTIIMPGDSVIFTFEASINDIAASTTVTNRAFINNNSIELTPQVAFPIEAPAAPQISGFPSDLTVSCDSVPRLMPINEPNCTFSNVPYPAAQTAGTQAMDGVAILSDGVTSTFGVFNGTILENFRVADGLYPRTSLDNSPCGASTRAIDFSQSVEESNDTYGPGTVSHIEWDFSQPVSELSFNINDLDEGDYFVDGVEVHIYDVSGTEIPYECGHFSLGNNVDQIGDNEFQAFDNFNGYIPVDNSSSDGDIKFSFLGLDVKRVEIILKNKWNSTSTSGTSAGAFASYNSSNPNAEHGVGIGQICYCIPGTNNGSIVVLNDCGNNFSNTYNQVRTEGTCADEYFLTRTWTFTDYCGNETTHVQTLTVIDAAGPVLVGIPADISVTPTTVPAPPCIGAEQNLAASKPTSQSSIGYGLPSSLAVDDNTNNYTHTADAPSDLEPWWEVDLLAVEDIGVLEIWNRTSCCSDRLQNFYVFVSDVPFTSTDISSTISQPGVFNYYEPNQALTSNLIPINRTGRYVRIQLTGTSILSLAEVRVIPPECVVAIDNCSYATINFSQDTTITGCTSVINRIWTATDNCGQITRDTQRITLDGLVSVTASVTSDHNGEDISCIDGSDGEVTAEGVGDYPPFNYAWNDSANQTTAIATGLQAGTYIVTITDFNGCTAIDSVIVNNPDSLFVTASITSNYNGEDVRCNGSSDGSVLANGSGGTDSLTYVWSEGGATTKALSGIGAGIYTVTVTDQNNCTATAEVEITEPDSVLVTIDTDTNFNGYNVSCNGVTDGGVTVVASSNVSITGYAWSSGQTGAVLLGLDAGTYTVTATDQNGCQGTAQVTLTEPDSLIGNFTINSDYFGQPISCAGVADGTLEVSPVGGIPGYTFLWNTGDTTAIADSLSAGTYIVTITDGNGCESTASYILDDPDVLDADSVITNISCYGENDGSIEITPQGGTAGYTILWNDTDTTFNRTGLSAGNYQAIITDVNGCTVEVSGTVVEPDTLVASSSEIDETCLTSGSIDLTVGGGTTPYSYLWSNTPASTSQDLIGVVGGTYTVTVTDFNNCTVTLTAVVEDQTGLNGSLDATNISCYGLDDGSIDLTVSGGASPYSYLWSTGDSIQDISSLPPATYTVTITDDNTCQAIASVEVIEPDSLDVTYNLTSPTCYADSDGSIDITVSGGTTDYSYLWNGGETTQDLSNISVGTYTLTVTDANLCQKIIEVDFNVLDSLNTAIVIDSDINGFAISCKDGNDGEARANVSGGTTPYTYLWSDPLGQTTSSASNLEAGTYTVTVTDFNDCIATATVSLTEPPTTVSFASVDSTNLLCKDDTNGSIDIEVTGGVTPYIYLWTGGATTQDINGLVAGTYTVIVTDDNDCVITTSVQITEPDTLFAYAGPDVNACPNESVNLVASATGGTTNYGYEWSTGATTASITIDTINTSIYTVTVTDANNCISVDQVTVNIIGCTEICNNGIDDDGDGDIDENDSDCESFWLEAECGTIGSNWNIVYDSTLSSNDYYLNVPNGTGNFSGTASTSSDDYVTYNVNVTEAGNFNLFGRVLTPTGGDDSFWIRANGGSWIYWSAGINTAFTWVQTTDTANGDTLVVFPLITGNNTIDISFREDGISLDKLYISKTNVAPTGEGEAASSCPIPEICDNGIDDDGDGFIDNADTDCQSFWLEAECATIGSDWDIVTDTVALDSISNDYYLTVPNGTGFNNAVDLTTPDKWVTFNFELIKDGNFRVNARVSTPSGSDDSFWVRMNGGTWIHWNAAPNIPFTWQTVRDALDSDNIVNYPLLAGSNSLDIAFREDGVSLDKIYITESADIPTGEGEAAPSCTFPEICDNGLDEDGDGFADCDDPDCAPIANDALLTTCDNSNNTGSGTFFLHDANPTVSTESGVMISYHTNLVDAQAGSNTLISPYNSADGTVYARVERISTGCYATSVITLDVGVKCVENCNNGIDDDGDGLIDCDDPDCPCCKSYAPTLNGLNKKDP